MFRPLLIFIPMTFLAVPAHSQLVESQSGRKNSSTADTKPMPPVRQLEAFYRTSRGFLNNLQTPRISGRGWKFAKDTRKQFREQIDVCLQDRNDFLAKASESETLDDVFWSKVIAAELAAEFRLASLLDEVLSPDEQKAFLVENAREYAGVVFYTPTFIRLAELGPEQEARIKKTLEQSLRLRSEMFRKPPSEFGPEPRVNFLQGLTVKQLEVLFKLQARMDEDMSMKEYLEFASHQEIDFLAKSSEEVRALVMKMSKERGS